MELLTDTAAILRRKYRYRGFIHLKVIPGASEAAILRALSLASAVSLNIEAPGARYFSQLSSYKNFERDIVRAAEIPCRTGCLRRSPAAGAVFDPVHRGGGGRAGPGYRALHRGDLPETELRPGLLFRLSAAEADRIPAGRRQQRRAAAPGAPALQADFLMRSVPFPHASEMEFGGGRPTSTCRPDPKQRWAERHPEFFPVRLNTAGREELLRVPGNRPRPTPTASSPAAARCGCGTGSTSASKARAALKAARYAVFN